MNQGHQLPNGYWWLSLHLFPLSAVAAWLPCGAAYHSGRSWAINGRLVRLVQPYPYPKKKHNMRKSMNIYEHLWTSMNIYEHHLWTSMNIYEHLWTSMNIYEHLWTSMNIYEHLWPSMNIYETLKHVAKFFHLSSSFRSCSVRSVLRVALIAVVTADLLGRRLSCGEVWFCYALQPLVDRD